MARGHSKSLEQPFSAGENFLQFVEFTYEQRYELGGTNIDSSS